MREIDSCAFIEAECDNIASCFKKLKSLSPQVDKAAKMIIASLKAGGKVMFCGNGGSAADSQHLAAELTGRYQMERIGMAGLALTVDTSAITAIANDYEYESIFSRQLEALARNGDVLYAISTSGNSKNVLLAADKARELGVKVIAATGMDGGALAGVADVLLNVPAETSNHIQEMHIAMGHMICGIVERVMNA